MMRFSVSEILPEDSHAIGEMSSPCSAQKRLRKKRLPSCFVANMNDKKVARA
jgi:hypothetical protein